MVAATSQTSEPGGLGKLAPVFAGFVAFALLFAEPLRTLVNDWLTDPDAGHGLLLAPLALWLGWRSGIVEDRRPRQITGIVMLAMAVLLRSAAALAAETFTMRVSMVMALVAMVLFAYGWRQIVRWWLPLSLIVLAIPLPDVLLGSLALPLQFLASKMGAALLDWRHVPVQLAGNIIYLPGQALFVTEACSGLRSLTALISLALILGAFWLKSPWVRATLVVLALPIAIVLNGIRVFLTGFVVFFISPAAGEGVMHFTEGWFLFVLAFLALNVVASALAWGERVRERHGRLT
jgi:exosortase